MKVIHAKSEDVLYFGRRGENLARQIVFDLSDFLSEYGDGTAELIVQRPGEMKTYPAAIVQEGATVTWTLTAADTALSSSICKNGHCELLWYVGDVLVKSKIWRTWVDNAMDTPNEETPPEPEQGWVDQVVAVGTAAKASADTAKAQADAAAQSAAGAAKSAQQAAESAAVYDNVVTDVTQLKADIAANEKADAVTKRGLDALWKLNQGVSYEFQTDDAEAYSKAVPTGAKLASVEAVGGKTVVWNQIIPSKAAETKGGIAITPNVDGSYHIVGTASDNVYFIFTKSSKTISGHKYLFYGSPAGAGALTYTMQMCAYALYLTDNVGRIVTVNEGSDATVFQFFVGKNQTVDFVIRPFCVDITQAFGVEKAENLTMDSPEIAWVKQYAEAHPEYNAGELASADVESVLYDGTVAGNIPESVRSLPGYGWSAGNVHNSIERTETGWQYVQRVGCVDLGTLNWKYSENMALFRADYDLLPEATVKGTQGICAEYFVDVSDGELSDLQDKSIKLSCSKISTAKRIYVYDTSTTDVDAIKASLSGVMLYFELGKEIITDITDLMDGVLDAITVETGGTITLENAAKLSVPNSVEYAVKLSEVGA